MKHNHEFEPFVFVGTKESSAGTEKKEKRVSLDFSDLRQTDTGSAQESTKPEGMILPQSEPVPGAEEKESPKAGEISSSGKDLPDRKTVKAESPDEVKPAVKEKKPKKAEKSRREGDGEEEDPEKKPSFLRSFLSLIVELALVICIALLLLVFVVQKTKVDGSSMEPGLMNGDQLFMDKISYRFHNPERFDIIIFKYRKNPSVSYVKRIIGLPGETVQIVGNTILINGKVLKEHYGREPMLQAGRAELPIHLGPKEYFVLGDNRNYSKDSRTEDVGNVERSSIIGRAWLRIWPLNRFGLIRHQTDPLKK